MIQRPIGHRVLDRDGFYKGFINEHNAGMWELGDRLEPVYNQPRQDNAKALEIIKALKKFTYPGSVAYNLVCVVEETLKGNYES